MKKLRTIARIIVSTLCVWVAIQELARYIPPAWAQTACTIRTQSALLNFFADNVPAFSITPSNVRDFLCSSANFSLTPTGAGSADTIANWFGDIFLGNPTTVSGNFSTLATNHAYTPDAAYGIVGTTGANNANTGSWGEYLTATTNSVGVTSGSATTITSESLTAGDWDVWSYCSYAPATTASMTQIACGVNTATNAFGAFFQNIQQTSGDFPVTTGQNIGSVPTRVSQGTTGTVYCIGQSTFSTGTVAISCTIFARRVR